MDGRAKNNNTTETGETWDHTDKCDLLRQGYVSAMVFEHERINKDVLSQENNLLTISGQRTYNSVNFFPDERREFLGQIMLLHGNNSIAIIIRNVTEKERTVLFTVQAY